MITLSKELVLSKGVSFVGEDEDAAVQVIKAQLENPENDIKVVHFYGPSEIGRFREEVCTKVSNTYPILNDDNTTKETITHNKIPEHCKYEGVSEIVFGSFTKSMTYRKLYDGRVEGIQTKSSIPAIISEEDVIIVLRKLYEVTTDKVSRKATDSKVVRSLHVYIPGGY